MINQFKIESVHDIIKIMILIAYILNMIFGSSIDDKRIIYTYIA